MTGRDPAGGASDPYGVRPGQPFGGPARTDPAQLRALAAELVAVISGDPDLVARLHGAADLDSDPTSAHHTLGGLARQAAPGDHDHDARYAAAVHTHAVADLTNPYALPRRITQVRATAATTYANSTWTAVAFATNDIDDDGMHSTVTNTTRLTATRAGRYELAGGVGHTTASTAGRRGARWVVNGSATALPAGAVLEPAINPATSGLAQAARTVVVALAVGDYVELQAFQDSGGSQSTNAANAEYGSYATALYLGP